MQIIQKFKIWIKRILHQYVYWFNLTYSLSPNSVSNGEPLKISWSSIISQITTQCFCTIDNHSQFRKLKFKCISNTYPNLDYPSIEHNKCAKSSRSSLDLETITFLEPKHSKNLYASIFT